MLERGTGSRRRGEEEESLGCLETDSGEDRQDGHGVGSSSWVVGPSSTSEAGARPSVAGESVGR